MTDIVHIFYSGIGGQGGVVFPLIREGTPESTHAIAFYGVEPLAPAYSAKCEEMAIPYRYFRKEKGLSLGAQHRMARWIARQRPRAILAHSPATLYCCRLVKRRLPDIRIIAVEHHPNVLKGAKEWLLSAIAHYAADRIVFLSESYKSEVRKRLGALFRERKATVIPNGLELERYFSGRMAAPRQGRGLTIGMQGRMVEVKDFATLLRAFARLPRELVESADVHLELAGDGEDRAMLEALADSLGIRARVRFLGMLSHEELIARMHTWDVFTLSSLGETMSIALMEAMACGLPVVTTDVSGVAEFIDGHGNGLLVPPRDPAAMSAALEQLLASPGCRAQLSARASGYAEEHLSVRRSWSSYSEVAGLAREGGLPA